MIAFLLKLTTQKDKRLRADNINMKYARHRIVRLIAFVMQVFNYSAMYGILFVLFVSDFYVSTFLHIV